jgi:hypothetical protein
MANQAIIEAAGNVYRPVKGQYDISGFVNGVAAVAQGLVARKKLVSARESSADKLYLKTDNKIIQNKVLNLKEQYKNFNISDKEYQEAIIQIKNDIIKVDQINSILVEKNKEKLALNANPTEENWFLGIRDGSLTDNSYVNITTKYGTMYLDTFFEYDENGVLNGLTPTGDMVPLDQLKAISEKLPTKKLKKEFNNEISSWQIKSFGTGTETRWASSRDEFMKKIMVDIFDNGGNKSVMYTALIDNNLGFDLTNSKNETQNFNWHDWYLDPKNKALTVEQKAEYDRVLEGYDEDVREKAKGIVLSQIMDGDKSLVSDVKRYLTEMADYKKPLPKEEQTDYVIGSEFKPMKNAETKKLYGAQNLIDLMKKGKLGSNVSSRHLPNIYIGETDGKYAFYKRNFDSNKQDEQLTEFFSNTQADIAKTMKMIGPVLGLNTTKELFELDNFLINKGYLTVE